MVDKVFRKNRGWKIFGIIVIVIVILIALAVLWTLNYLGFIGIESGTFVPVNLTHTSLPNYLEKQSMIKGLPSESKINLFVGDYAYSIDGKEVREESIDNPDLVIYLPESYIETIGQIGLCGAIGKAVDSKELVIGAGNMASEDLAWKYKSILKYRKCFS